MNYPLLVSKTLKAPTSMSKHLLLRIPLKNDKPGFPCFICKVYSSSSSSDQMAFTGRFRELMKKYGKVALGVHCSVSGVSITGLYLAINNNVDVESLLSKVGISSGATTTDQEAIEQPETIPSSSSDGFITLDQSPPISSDQEIPPFETPKQRNRTAEMAASSGGALALAILCNKALFPVRVPITIALTPPIARFLARRKIINTHV